MKKIILVAGSIFLFSVASRAQNESPLYNEARIFMTFLKESGIVRAQYHDLYRDKNLRNDSIPLNFRTDGLDDVKFKTIFYKDKYDKRTLKRWRKLKQLPVDFHQLPSDVAPNFDLIFFYPPDHSYLVASLMPVPDPPQNYYYHLWHGYTPEATGSHYIAKLVDGRISLNTIQMIGFTFWLDAMDCHSVNIQPLQGWFPCVIKYHRLHRWLFTLKPFKLVCTQVGI